jgi:oligopeptide transport system substrate-binding protein
MLGGQTLTQWVPLRRYAGSWPLCLVLAAVLLTTSACTGQNDADKPQGGPPPGASAPTVGGTYRLPLGNDPANLDPARITDLYAVAVANQIFDSLVEFDEDLNVVPSLAQSWSTTRDRLVWTFKLRDDVHFQNGRRVIAEDVVYSLSRILDPAVRSPRSWFLDKVKGAPEFQAGTTPVLEGIKAIDPSTVEITLSEPFAPFINILGLPHTSIIPREEVERLGANFATNPVGTGPFRLTQWQRGQTIILDANLSHFRGRPALDRVQFVIFPGVAENDMIQAFEREELEESPIPPERRKDIIDSKRYTIVRKPTLSLRLLGFNLERPPFHQLEVRKAFNYAIDKVRLNQEVQGGRYVVAEGILPPGMPGYTPDIQVYELDQERAKSLLRQVREASGEALPPVTLSTGAKLEEVRREFHIVQQSLAAVDVQIELQEYDNWPSFRQVLQSGNFEFFRYLRYADYPDPDNFLYPLFHSQSQTNYFRYRNPAVDQLLDDARRETDDLRRVKLYREAEQIILEDAPAVMLWHFTYERAFQRYVKGIAVSALGDPYVPLRKVWLQQTGQANVRK